MFLPPHSMVERREENPRQETTGSPFIRISSEHDSLPQGALIDLPRQITHGLIINTVAGGGGGVGGVGEPQHMNSVGTFKPTADTLFSTHTTLIVIL